MSDEPQANALLGIGMVALATLFFAGADVLTKHLTPLYGVALVVSVRYLVNLGLIAAVWGPAQGRALWRTQRTALVVLRGLCLAGASLTLGLALKVMPVAESIAIIYLAPIAVMLVAWRFLERNRQLGRLARRAGGLRRRAADRAPRHRRLTPGAWRYASPTRP